MPVIEALAARCRVVATDAGALGETVAGFGELVAVDDVERLSDAMARALRWNPRGAELPGLDDYLRSFSEAALVRRTLLEAQSAVRTGRARTLEQLSSDRAGFAMRQSRLLEVLACPECHKRVDIVDSVEVEGSVAVG